MDKTELNIGAFENITNNMLPTMIKLLIAIGITVCLLSIVVVVYAYIKKKCDTKIILRYFIPTFISGAMVSIGGVLVNFIANFNIEFSTYKVEIPLYLIVSLTAFSLIMKTKNNTTN